jgi:DNA polymerase elongation subunit (family B)
MKFYTNVQSYGNNFLIRAYENGKRYKVKEEYQPTLYVPVPKGKSTPYKTIYGQPVAPIKPGTVKDCKAFLKKYENVDGFTVYGNERFVYQYISDMYPEDNIEFDLNKIKVYTIDIETTSEKGFPNISDPEEEILLITIKDLCTKEIITWGRKPFKDTENIPKFSYNYFSDEEYMLKNFLHWWEDPDNIPDIISGWNINFFDIPYLTKRIIRVLGENYSRKLSPWRMVHEGETVDNKTNRTYITFDWVGISSLDYLTLYKKFTYKSQESYSLDHIGEVELDEKKLDHSEYETFKDFYTKNWNKFTQYNIKDVDIVDKLEDKMKLIELAVTVAYSTKVNYNDIFSQVKVWDVTIYNYLKKLNIVIPPRKTSEKDSKYAGAYVKEPIPGKYDWVVSFDLTSLYPSLIMQYNISPETLMEERCPGVSIDKILNKSLNFEKYEGKSICANGTIYDNSKKGIFPEIVESIFNERQFYKKKMLEEKTNLEKIEHEIKQRKLLSNSNNE